MNRAWKVFDILEESAMMAGMVAMVILNFLNVICRYLLPQTPFSYTEELVVLIFVWVSMFGISYGYRRGSHTVLTLLSDLLPRRCQPVIILFAACASALLMVLLAKTGYGMVQNQMKFGQIFPGMKIPMAVVGWSLPVGAVFSLVSVVKVCCREMREAVKPERGGAQ
ncbi:MAG: TRAP transporter small permease [Synergistaceae bacterium]|jgi:TRAP-type C4-dicarboxylate transport system permease small subunit|nr:TRAP transporter small permease [Synergistaceae bacterium]